MLRPAIGLLVCSFLAKACALELSLPTDNAALFEKQPPEPFYMGVDREDRRVWQGGTFGFVRSPLVWLGGTVFTQFHEGIDIAPVRRDANGMPADEVRAISEGTVVLCETRGLTQYGNQVVLRHDWGDGPVYSRYAHLRSVTVALGDKVQRGRALGIMGYTGGALTVQRAHLHLEVDLMLQQKADLSWLPERAGDVRYHPANMKGVDAATLFLALRTKPELTMAEFVKAQTPYFSVATKADEPVDLLRRCGWLSTGKLEAPGWKMSFTEWGLPVHFEAILDPPATPQVVWVRAFEGKHVWTTGGLLSGTGESAVLSTSGLALLRLILGE